MSFFDFSKIFTAEETRKAEGMINRPLPTVPLCGGMQRGSTPNPEGGLRKMSRKLGITVSQISFTQHGTGYQHEIAGHTTTPSSGRGQTPPEISLCHFIIRNINAKNRPDVDFHCQTSGLLSEGKVSNQRFVCTFGNASVWPIRALLRANGSWHLETHEIPSNGELLSSSKPPTAPWFTR